MQAEHHAISDQGKRTGAPAKIREKSTEAQNEDSSKGSPSWHTTEIHQRLQDPNSEKSRNAGKKCHTKTQ